MLFFKRFPYMTVALAVVIIVAYWMLAADTPYITDENLDQYALTPAHPLSFLSHLFIHVGIFHLIGNLLPLIFFGLVLEGALGPLAVLLIFLVSGTLSSLLFALANPGIVLIGASAGISGMLSSVLLVRPKTALVLLIATPLLISLVFYPAADFASNFYQENLAERRVGLEKQLEVAVEQNEAPQVIEQLNVSLQETEEKIDITFEGREREEKTPTDFLVHVYGAVIGGLYVYFLHRKKLKEAEREFISIGAMVFGKVDEIMRRLKGR